MSHPLLSAPAPRRAGAVPSRIVRPAAWTSRPEAAVAEVAVLLTGRGDVAAMVRGYRTVLPRAQVWFYGFDLSAEERASAEAAGVAVRSVPRCGRDALVRRMFAEVDADIYILAPAWGAHDACLAPLIVAEVEAGRDLVDVRAVSSGSAPSIGDRLLVRAVDFAFGGWGDTVHSDFKACSRRFAMSYHRTAPRGGQSARDLALHALRLRLPVGRVTALEAERPDVVSVPPPGVAGWAALLGTIVRLLVEERPRRILGLAGLGLMALGIASAAPGLEFRHWRGTLLPGPRTLAAAASLAAGFAVAAAGVLLDTLAAARQEVGRLGAAAIPRRAERGTPAA